MSDQKLPTQDVLGLIRGLRTLNGAKQQHLAERHGITQATLSRMESGKLTRIGEPQDRLARQIALDLIDGLRAKV